MTNFRIKYTPHALDKLERLIDIGVNKKLVSKCICNPEKVVDGYGNRKIAQCLISSSLVVRIVYEKIGQEILIITIYPGKRSRYK